MLNTHKSMMTFIIPVKSAQVSGSWSEFSKLFERTIKSVTNQTVQDFKVVVVCHEKPEIDFEHPNVEYIYVDFQVPQLKTAPKEKHDGMKEEDKSNKILAGIEYAKKYKSDYLMVVDADDCISNKIVAFVSKNSANNSVGWYLNEGYYYREGDKIISLNKKTFNALCGTCIIIKPSRIKEMFLNVPHLLYKHQIMEFSDATSLSKLPFPGAIYSMANGENHYMSSGQIKFLNQGSIFKWSTIKGFIRKLKKYRIKTLSHKIIAEFGIYPLT